MSDPDRLLTEFLVRAIHASVGGDVQLLEISRTEFHIRVEGKSDPVVLNIKEPRTCCHHHRLVDLHTQATYVCRVLVENGLITEP